MLRLEAVETDIVAREGKAADHELLGRMAEAIAGAHGWVFVQHLTQRLRLLIEDQGAV